MFKYVAMTIVLLLSTSAFAQTWESISDEEALRELISGRTIRTELESGDVSTSRYNADGTGEINLWNDTFARQWKIENSLVCILIDSQNRCMDIERRADAESEYRAIDKTTGDVALFSLGENGIATSATSAQGAGTAGEPSAAELAAELANPTNPIMTLGNNFDFVFFDGDLPGASDQSSIRYVFQSVFPLKLANGATAFFRPAIPVMFNEPVPDGQGGFQSIGTDIADIGYDLSYSNMTPAGTLWGAGVAGTLPTASNDALGKNKWGLGPEILLGRMGKWGVVGGVLSHQWDIGGSGNAKIDLTNFNYFYAFPLGGGWQVAAGPTISYDHTKDDDNLTVPLGIGLARTMKLGGRVWKFQAQYWNYVKRADAFAPEHQIRLSISPVVSAPWNDGR
jgi:predicted transposase YbfD/YdcC